MIKEEKTNESLLGRYVWLKQDLGAIVNEDVKRVESEILGRMEISKKKLIDWLKTEIKSCEVVNSESDKAIKWECEKIIDRINLGFFK